MSHLGRSDAEQFVTEGSSFLVTCPGGILWYLLCGQYYQLPCYVVTSLPLYTYTMLYLPLEVCFMDALENC